MATAAAQQRTKLLRSQLRRPMPGETAGRTPDAPSDRGAALRLASSLATGRRNKEASLDRQVAGEVGARAGQLAGAFLGGIGAPIGKRLGRVLGEHWRIALLVLFVQIGLPLLFLAVGLFVILATLRSFFP